MLGVSAAQAIPANPRPFVVTQPDGSQLTLKINGDEHYNFYTTVDGYTVMQNTAGYYVYAKKAGNQLTATTTIARNADQRSTSEVQLLNSIGKRVIDKARVETANMMRATRNEAMKRRVFDYSQFKGLVLLVEFNDCSFSRSDVADFYEKMINQPNYTGYTNEDGTSNYYGKYTGSVRDYFYDNSYETFDPHFDIVGPIKLTNYSVNSPNQTSNMRNILIAALKAANDSVDYSQYDLDGNGSVDIFYVIFAGVGSNTGEASQHVWPHASYLWPSATYDNVRLNRYACSCELYSQDYNILDGIGTMCHEFSHVLGLPDLYDTDYAENGQAVTPSEYEIMDGGGYNNTGRTPAGYSAYDKYSLEFAPVTVIDQPGDYSLNPLSTHKEIFKINSPVNNEFFLLENRQKTGKWDAYIPGHGMMVARVDSTDASVWTDNNVNDNPNHLYYEILRANGSDVAGGDATDPFPGTKGVTMITNATQANLLGWTGTENPLSITSIQENEGVISFSVLMASDILSDVEDFETMPTSTSTTEKDVEGHWASWSFTKSNVTAPGEGKCNGVNSVQMKLPSTLECSDTYYDAYQISARVFNTTTTDAKLTLSYSTDGGQTWQSAKSSVGEASIIINKKSTGTPTWMLTTSKNTPTRYRFQQIAGNKNSPIYVDDIIIYYTDKGSDLLQGDVNRDGKVNVSDVSTLINMILGMTEMDQEAADVNGDGRVNVSDVTALINIILGV